LPVVDGFDQAPTLAIVKIAAWQGISRRCVCCFVTWDRSTRVGRVEEDEIIA
jgi:hypothetical protein